MGRSITPTYVAEFTVNHGHLTPMAWDCKRYGRPTDANAEKFRKFYNMSFQPGRVNGPLTEDDVILHISEVRVIRNDGSKEVVATATAPLFEVM